MPTFDQLPAEQRAIIELVVQRGRTYDQLADALDITPKRVRELAHDALVELSPRTAERVDEDRRSQIADYVLNQQTSAEASATRSHLKRSEAGRMWILSLLDSLEHMYENGNAPEVPAAEAAEERPRRRERERERPARERERPRERAPLREPARDREPLRREAPRQRAEPLTPEAQRAVRNRRIAAVVGALLILGAIVAVVVVAVIPDPKVTKARAPETKVVGQLMLNPLNRGSENQGIAIVAQRGDDRSLIVQARLNPSQKDQAYEVWLYNSDKDAVSLGAQVTDKDGNYQGAGRLPAPLDKYRYIDVSLERLDRNTAHSGNSVLRGEIAKMQEPTEENQPGAGGQQQPGAGQQPTP